MRGNFLDVPTDCPQRDERLGWTGDIQVFSPTASFLFDTAGFLTSWLADLAAEQHADGAVPVRDPGRALHARQPCRGRLGRRGDAACRGCSTSAFGDLGRARAAAAEHARPGSTAWRRWPDADRLWAGGFQFGDWLDPTAPPDKPFRAKADADVVATAHLARSAEIVAGLRRSSASAMPPNAYGQLAARVAARSPTST